MHGGLLPAVDCAMHELSPFVPPGKDRTSFPVLVFHILTVPSKLPEASHCPSGLKARALIKSPCPRKGLRAGRLEFKSQI